MCECGWPIYSTIRVTITCPNCKATVVTDGSEPPRLTSPQEPKIPTWVAVLQARRAPEDKGVGDTFARLLGSFGEAFKATTRLLGVPCCCAERQAEWNERWPYEATESSDGDWPETQQPMTDRLVAVTSLSPLAKHQETQPATLDSWRLAGLAIVAVNTQAEIEALRPLYPQVSRWVESADQCPAYSFPTQRINALCSAVTDSPFLLINSDIQLRGDQQRLFDILDSGKVGVGIRHNYVGHWRSAEREGWGIDAFLMTPAQAATLPQLPFAIGRPMWDYWLPYHFDHIGQPMEWIGEPYFYHAAHPVHWDRSDLELGRSWLEQQYGVIEDWLNIRDRWPFPPPHHKSMQKPPPCVVCHEPATRICSYTLSLGMCGYPLCDDCTHAHTL